MVLYESPFRLIKLMTLCNELDSNMTVFVGRELTKAFEECLTDTPSGIIRAFEDRKVKGELGIVLSGSDLASQPSEDELT